MNKETVLSVKNLCTYFNTSDGIAKAVDNISFDIRPGKTLALVGESGCGKSVTALSIMRLVQGPAGKITGGEILFHGKALLGLTEKEMRKIRGEGISMIFQEPMTSLNPVISIGEQITEVITLHTGVSKKEAYDRALEMMEQVRIPDPLQRLSEYPHQLSGGMKQRVMIAIALSCKPDLLIADEPTTALDVTVQAQILNLMKELQKKRGTSILLITHDMGIVYENADYIAVMYAGRIVEYAERSHFFKNACHPYTTKLFESLPNHRKRNDYLSTIPGRVPQSTNYPNGCRFYDRCHYSFDKCVNNDPVLRVLDNDHKIACHLNSSPKIVITSEINEKTNYIKKNEDSKNILKVDALKIHYPIRKGLFKRTVGWVKAVDGVELSINTGETVALVGESGCGKTTVGKGIIRLIDISGGSILFNGIDLFKVAPKRLREMRKGFQIMFQDPYASLNPRMMVGQIISEGLISQRICKGKKEREVLVKNLLEKVGLDPGIINKYPHEFSGGQRQRIGIARFLAVNPRFIVCDEVTSALDVSVQAQILNLLKSLQNENKLSYLFITHNLSVVAYMADKVAVMYLGRIVELGSIQEIFNTPMHPYTRALHDASPRIGVDSLEKIVLEGDVPSPVTPPSGCHFHPRCPEAIGKCKELYPPKFTFSKTHSAMCWLHELNH